jgi:putative ABC transport system permease protein
VGRLSALAYGLLGVLAALAGGWMPARAAQKLPPAQTLKGLGLAGHRVPAIPGWRWRCWHCRWAGAGTAGVGHPLAAYVAIALFLVGGISALPALIGLLYNRLAPPLSRWLLPMLAIERARRVRQCRGRHQRRGRLAEPGGGADGDGGQLP